jgi:hypothetical protein
MQQSYSNYGSFAVATASDTTRINCRAIYIGSAGDLSLSVDGVATPVVIQAIPAGTILPIMLDGGRIMAASTAGKMAVLA